MRILNDNMAIGNGKGTAAHYFRSVAKRYQLSTVSNNREETMSNENVESTTESNVVLQHSVEPKRTNRKAKAKGKALSTKTIRRPNVEVVLPVGDDIVGLSSDSAPLAGLRPIVGVKFDGGNFDKKEREAFRKATMHANASIEANIEAARRYNVTTLEIAGYVHQVVTRGWWRMDNYTDTQTFDEKYGAKARDGYIAWFKMKMGINSGGRVDQLIAAHNGYMEFLPYLRNQPGITRVPNSETEMRALRLNGYNKVQKQIEAQLSAHTETSRDAERVSQELANQVLASAWRRGLKTAQLAKNGEGETFTVQHALENLQKAYEEVVIRKDNQRLKLDSKKPVITERGAGNQGNSPTDSKDNEAAEKKETDRIAKEQKDLMQKARARGLMDILNDFHQSVFINLKKAWDSHEKARIKARLPIDKYLSSLSQGSLNSYKGAFRKASLATISVNYALDNLKHVPSTGEPIPADKVQTLPAQSEPTVPTAQPRKRNARKAS